MIRSEPALVSINELELQLRPPTANPCARMVPFVGRESPVTCQPPATRVPAPIGKKSVAFVEASKLVRHTSGPAPARNQVIVEPSKERVSVAGSVLFRRPMCGRAWPASAEKYPPARIL